jgi:hypothetical protein
MKNRFKAISSVVFLLFALGFPCIMPAAPPPHDHPRIEAAMHALEDARNELNSAPHDFGGHRGDAISAIDHAMKQLRICMQY